MAGRMTISGLITSDLAVVFWQPSRMAITNHLATVFWLLSGMASRFTSSFISVAAAPRWAVYAFCLLISVFSPLHAEDFPDPTRPPASIFAPAAGAGTGQMETENRSSGLHSIIISETRRAAIIDGQTVELGGEHGDARLIEVNEGGVVLQRAQSRQVLTLFPDVKITRKETSDKEAVEKKSPNKESPNKESQVKQPSSASKVQSGKHKTKPAAHKEKLLSEHPKEEK